MFVKLLEWLFPVREPDQHLINNWFRDLVKGELQGGGE
jgi:hypothetical protein